ncbi:MAG: N-acetylmuramoyl-L-alanine amidase [Clostridia bacterium]|nr:N-acetylmuramoyl-L-alanine amidase [Clostridia bacterium]
MMKKFLTGCALALGVLLAFGCCIGAITHAAYCEYHTPEVVLDAGHGGIDGGVVGKQSGVKESDVNLSIVYSLKEYLEERGVKVVLTRKTEAGLYGTTAKYFKKRDMEKRREIIEKASPNVVVSIHQNFFSNLNKRGATVFYRQGDGCGESLARCIQSQFNGNEGTPSARTPLLGDYFILNCTNYPSVIVECAFLSNREDEALLITEEYRRTVAERVANGILSYLLKENQAQ